VLQNLFKLERRVPASIKVHVAIWPDGQEFRIVRQPGCGWAYARGCAAGPRKQDAIEMAKSEGARIEERAIPNPLAASVRAAK
jgi:hypothetical protein